MHPDWCGARYLVGVMNRYRIHTPMYAPGQLVEAADGNIFKRDEVIEALEPALAALKRVSNHVAANSYQASELSEAIDAIEQIVSPAELPEVSEHV